VLGSPGGSLSHGSEEAQEQEQLDYVCPYPLQEHPTRSTTRSSRSATGPLGGITPHGTPRAAAAAAAGW